MAFLTTTQFTTVADRMARQVRQLDIDVLAANAAGSHGSVYATVSSLDDPDVETNALMLALEAMDAAVNLTDVVKGMTAMGDFLSGTQRSLARASVTGGLNGWLSLAAIDTQVSTWFSLIHSIHRGSHLDALNVFPTIDDTSPIEMLTLDVGAYQGTTGPLATGFTGTTGITGVAGEEAPGAAITITNNPVVTVSGNPRLGTGSGKHVPHDATDSSKLNASGARMYVEVTVGTLTSDLLLRINFTHEDLTMSDHYITILDGSTVGTQTFFLDFRFLQINSVTRIFGGTPNTQLKMYAQLERDITV